MRAELPQRTGHFLLAPRPHCCTGAARARRPQSSTSCRMRRFFAPLSPATGRSRSPETLANDMRPADFGRCAGFDGDRRAADLVSLASSRCCRLGLVSGCCNSWAARASTPASRRGTDRVVMDTAAGASVDAAESLDAPAPAAEPRATDGSCPRQDDARKFRRFKPDPQPHEAKTPPYATGRGCAARKSEIACHGLRRARGSTDPRANRRWKSAPAAERRLAIRSRRQLAESRRDAREAADRERAPRRR